MIDNLRGLARLFTNTTARSGTLGALIITPLATRLCHADMGAAAVQRHMPEEYHKIVAEARAWLRRSAALDDLAASDAALI